MAIRVLSVKAAPVDKNEDDIVASIVSGTGVVPAYVDDGVPSLRFGDLDIAEKWAAAIAGSTIEDFEGSKRPHYLRLPAGYVLRLNVQHLSSKMSLRAPVTFEEIRSCDGVDMAGDSGESCVCAKLADHGTPAMRDLQATGQACKPTGFIVATVVGLEHLGKVSFSKGSESTVRPIVELEESTPTPFTVTLAFDQVTSKKGHTWSIPAFSNVEPGETAEPF